jgi:sugar phosphate permease
MPAARQRRAWVVFAALAAGYSTSQFFRASPTVIAPELMHDLSIGSEALGGVVGLFFLAFGLAQLPVGIMLDRLGPRITMSCLMLVAVAGAVVFAVAQSAAVVGAGRSLMGIGCAAGLMGSMVVLGRWFPPAKFATLSGLLMGIGSIGVLMGASPLALAVAEIGWRGAFLASAVVTAALAAIVFAVVRDAPDGEEPLSEASRETPRQVMEGLLAVPRNRPLRRIIAMQLTIYPSVMTVAGLWAGPYLADVHGLDTEARGEVLNLLFGALVISPILFGPLDRIFNTRKRVVMASACTLSCTLMTLALWPGPALWQAVALLLVIGIASPGSLILHAHARSTLPERLIGRGLTLQNMAAIGGIFLLQWASGAIIGLFETTGGAAPEAAYRAAFGFLAVMLLLSLAIYAGAKDVKPGETADAGRAA